ncbi:hypothetical protein JCM11641_003000 [Rhodosporidiobolus odoratus]
MARTKLSLISQPHPDLFTRVLVEELGIPVSDSPSSFRRWLPQLLWQFGHQWINDIGENEGKGAGPIPPAPRAFDSVPKITHVAVNEDEPAPEQPLPTLVFNPSPQPAQFSEQPPSISALPLPPGPFVDSQQPTQPMKPKKKPRESFPPSTREERAKRREERAEAEAAEEARREAEKQKTESDDEVSAASAEAVPCGGDRAVGEDAQEMAGAPNRPVHPITRALLRRSPSDGFFARPRSECTVKILSNETIGGDAPSSSPGSSSPPASVTPLPRIIPVATPSNDPRLLSRSASTTVAVIAPSAPAIQLFSVTSPPDTSDDHSRRPLAAAHGNGRSRLSMVFDDGGEKATRRQGDLPSSTLPEAKEFAPSIHLQPPTSPQVGSQENRAPAPASSTQPPRYQNDWPGRPPLSRAPVPAVLAQPGVSSAAHPTSSRDRSMTTTSPAVLGPHPRLLLRSTSCRRFRLPRSPAWTGP